MGRVEATQGAAVRDTDGRTYAAAPVSLPTLSLSALQVAVAVAASSGATGLEAAVLLGGEADDPGLPAAADLGVDVTVIITDRAGRESVRLAHSGDRT
ncbi:cytidine deaminase [Williamsia sp.]|uniref:cytidine deaminase n=1 Tax=Williamsia sp. TaxID=1872085 RepID=UPI001A2A1A1D|nr:cytidine deaminase [Williamsia sp.]MBJ7288143.1 cytidine deaminase [Williamsia sp.]